MNSITIEGANLVIEPRGLDKLWGLRSLITVPLDHVQRATMDADIADEPKGFRSPGLHLPGKTVGTFRRNGEVVYWNVSHPTDNVVIEFSDEQLDRAVLTVPDPAATARQINAAIPQLGE